MTNIRLKKDEPSQFYWREVLDLDPCCSQQDADLRFPKQRREDEVGALTCTSNSSLGEEGQTTISNQQRRNIVLWTVFHLAKPERTTHPATHTWFFSPPVALKFPCPPANVSLQTLWKQHGPVDHLPQLPALTHPSLGAAAPVSPFWKPVHESKPKTFQTREAFLLHSSITKRT